MARAPRTRSPLDIEPDTSPLDDAVIQDQQGVAGDLTEILEAVRGFDQGSIKGILYRRPSGGIGKYEWIEEIAPPFDLSAIFNDLKERFGGGDFQLRIFAGGRIRKNIDFSIVKEKTALVAPPKDSSDTMAMFQMMMAMQQQAAQASQASADRQMQMMMTSNQQSSQMMMAMMTAIVPALAGGREKTSDLMQAIAAMQPKGEGMKEALETLTLAKGLFKDETPQAGFDADDLVGSAIKLGGPLIGAVGKAFSERRGTAENPAATYDHGAQEAPPLMLPQEAPQTVPVGGTGRYPVLDLIRSDVLYMFRHNHNPQIAADLVYDTIEAHGVSDEALNELVAAFSISADWIADLAVEGIDLRSRPEWATEFLQSLIAIHTDPEREPSDFERGNGSEGNPTDNGELSPQG